MRIRLAIVLSLICRSALAAGSDDTPGSTGSPISVGKPHVCSAYYPAEALKAYAQGSALLDFIVAADGTVRNVEVTTSSGNKDLDDASLSCVSRWRYKPATKDGVAVDIPWKANVVWKIEAPPEMQAAVHCFYYRQEHSPPPSDLGHTMLSFRVLQNGSVKDVAVTQSSGYRDWDGVGIECLKGRQFDMSMFTLPSEGLPGHWDINWLGAITFVMSGSTLPPVAFLPPPK